MDILNSKILNIEGRLYINYYEEQKLQVEECEDVQFEPLLSNPQKDNENGGDQKTCVQLKCFVQCPSALFRHVIGHRGQNIKRLQQETGSKIEIPRGKNPPVSGITITAESSESLDAATTRIQLLLVEKRWKEPFKHFVSIPITAQSVKDGHKSFKGQVLAKSGREQGITEKLFQNGNKIHLTIGTLVLLDDSECERAVAVLKQVQGSALFAQAKSMNIRVHGIEYMNDDPSMVDVLYAKASCPDDPDLLQQLADDIVSQYVSAGLMKREHEHVKLHATVMNTLRTMERSQVPQRGPKATPRRETFDATNILADFKDYHFGEFPFSEIHISKKHTADENGYYESLYVCKCVES